MRLWFAPGSEVPIYRQLVTQVVLAILSGDLAPGERLPSTRELARRFALHPNTISAGYRQLQREGWTEQRRGSGVFVRADAEKPATPEQVLDHHIAAFFRAVRELKLPPEVVRARVAQWLAAPAPDHLLLVDADEEARRILLTELHANAKLPVREASLEDCKHAGIKGAAIFTGAIPLCRPSQARTVRAAMPAGVELITLPIRSALAWLSVWVPGRNAPTGHLVGIVSRWPEFISLARTMLIATGLPAESLITRDARRRGWERGLSQASVVLCDAHIASLNKLPRGPRVAVFPLLADGALAEISS